MTHLPGTADKMVTLPPPKWPPVALSLLAVVLEAAFPQSPNAILFRLAKGVPIVDLSFHNFEQMRQMKELSDVKPSEKEGIYAHRIQVACVEHHASIPHHHSAFLGPEEKMGVDVRKAIAYSMYV